MLVSLLLVVALRIDGGDGAIQPVPEIAVLSPNHRYFTEDEKNVGFPNAAEVSILLSRFECVRTRREVSVDGT